MSKANAGADNITHVEMPASARGRPSSMGAMSRGDGSATPLTRRAEQYYGRLLGRADGSDLDARQDWSLIAELDKLDHTNREERQRLLESERKAKNLAELEEQLEKRNIVKAASKEVWRKWGLELEKDAEQYKLEDEQKRARALEKQSQVREERERHLVESRQRKAELKAETLKHEREMLRQAAEDKKLQDDADLKKKLDQRVAMQKVHAEAGQMQKEREQVKEQERLQDIKDQEKYEKHLDQQDKNRGNYFKVIREKQQKMLAKYEQNVGNDVAKLQKEDDERAERYAQARYDKEHQDHEAREKWRKQQRDSGKATVHQQLAIQAQERERVAEEDTRYLDQKLQEAYNLEAMEVEKAIKRKETLQANAEFLRKQIQEKRERAPQKRIQQSQMSDIERSLNRDKLQRACDANRADGLPMLLRKKRDEYAKMKQFDPISLPC